MRFFICVDFFVIFSKFFYIKERFCLVEKYLFFYYVYLIVFDIILLLMDDRFLGCLVSIVLLFVELIIEVVIYKLID